MNIEYAPQVTPKLRVVVTSMCNCKCTFCGGMTSRMENIQPSRLDRVPMTTKQRTRVIEAYARTFPKGDTPPSVQCTGGEPLMADDLIEVVGATKRAGIRSEINTNGILLDDKNIEALRDAGLDRLKISIPSFNREGYFRITGIDALEKVKKKVLDASKVLNVRVNHVLTTETLSEIPAALEWCRDVGLTELVLLEVVCLPHHNVPHIHSQYVDVLARCKAQLEKLYNAEFVRIGSLESIWGIEGSAGMPSVYVRQARDAWRISACRRCKVFCQEGVYGLRLSEGGYLSVCPAVTSCGRLVTECDESLDSVFTSIYADLTNLYKTSYAEFVKKHKLKDIT